MKEGIFKAKAYLPSNKCIAKPYTRVLPFSHLSEAFPSRLTPEITNQSETCHSFLTEKSNCV